MKDKLAEALAEREARRRSSRASLETLWQRVARYVSPREATFTETVTPGVERNRQVLDSTAPQSLELFGSFIHTLMNNPAARWINISAGLEDDKLSVGMKQWKENAEKQMQRDLAARNAGYYAAAHQTYLDQGAFGTGCVFLDAVNGRPITRHYHLADVVIEENTYGIVDSVDRQFMQSPRQAQQRWKGIDLGKDAMSTDSKRQEPMRFLHCVFPTDDEEIMALIPKRERARIERMPVASVWINAKEHKTVRVGGFEEMPYMTPRWYKTRGEIYGRSPAMTVLPTITMVNRMLETILRGAEKLVDPPLVIRDGGLVSPVRLFPGAVTFTDGEVKIEALVPPGASRVEYGDELLKRQQEMIRQGFFIPLFMSPESPVKTATQTLQETQERNRAVSPMLVRQHEEFHHPLVRRLYGLELRLGRIEPPPEAVPNLSVEYVSPLMSSQKELEALGAMRIIESLLPWAQIDPAVLDRFDPDQVALVTQAGSGAPASIMRTDSQVKTVREERAKQNQANSMMEAIKNLTPAIKAGADVQAAQAKPGGR